MGGSPIKPSPEAAAPDIPSAFPGVIQAVTQRAPKTTDSKKAEEPIVEVMVRLVTVNKWTKKIDTDTPVFLELRTECIKVEEAMTNVQAVTQRLWTTFENQSLVLCSTNLIPVDDSEETRGQIFIAMALTLYQIR